MVLLFDDIEMTFREKADEAIVLFDMMKYWWWHWLLLKVAILLIWLLIESIEIVYSTSTKPRWPILLILFCQYSVIDRLFCEKKRILLWKALCM